MDNHLPLGFGCSVLGGDLSAAKQRAILDAALDAGFRYFDVAPSYGNGNSERVLGQALSGAIDRVTIATKVGIGHPSSNGFDLVRRAVRPLKAVAPALWGRVARRARQAVAPRGRFGVGDVQATVQESMRRLGVKRLDRLLLHEVTVGDLADDLLKVLDTLVRSGTVGAIGLGTSVEASQEILALHPNVFSIVQVPHYWGAFSPGLGNRVTQLVTHRCLRNGAELAHTDALERAVGDHALGAELRRWLADPGARPELLLKAGLLLRPEARMLVSSSDPARVRRLAFWAKDDSAATEARALNECLWRIAKPGTTMQAER